MNPSALQQCTKRATNDVSSRGFRFYKNTQEFYSAVGTEAGLDASVQSKFTLGFTLRQASNTVSEATSAVAGSSLVIMASYRQDTVDKSCLLDGKQFDESFLGNFQRLPTTISEPWDFNSWKSYDMFLKQYGSHIVTSTVLGSSINQEVFAESSKSYHKRDFQVKGCLSLAGPIQGAVLGLSACAGIKKEEISRVSTMSFTDDLVIRGGTSKTRNKLLENRSPDLIERFMNEAKTTNTAIQFRLTSVWDILERLYAGRNGENYARALNLGYYYLGFLNYGCQEVSNASGKLPCKQSSFRSS